MRLTSFVLMSQLAVVALSVQGIDVILDSSIYPRIHQGAKRESAILLSGDRDGPALEMK